MQTTKKARKMLLHVFLLALLAFAIIGGPVVFASIRSENRNVQKATRIVLYNEYLVNSFGGHITITSEEDLKGLLINLYNPGTDGLSPNSLFYYDYIAIALYNKETGNVISHYQVEAFLYEDGQHGEVTTYLEWAAENRIAISDYRARLRELYYAYADGREGFPVCFPHLLPAEMIDELIRGEADKDYQMDLMSIQNRFIADGRARVFRDGKTIDFRRSIKNELT